jgi:hypothetical protein
VSGVKYKRTVVRGMAPRASCRWSNRICQSRRPVRSEPTSCWNAADTPAKWSWSPIPGSEGRGNQP